MDPSLLPVLRRLAREPWRTSHQDIAQYLVDLDGGDEVVDELEFLALAGPEFQDYPGSTALTRHAVHGLERIGTRRARSALQRLGDHPEDDVRALIERIDRRLPPLDTGAV
jgi:hypothetical protein